MSMFDNYDRLSQNYIPSNLNPQNLKPQTCTSNKPYEEYDALGNLIGYWWYKGNTIDMFINFSGEVTIDSDVVVLNIPGDTPLETTIGHLDQYCTNLMDDKWWQCTSIENINSQVSYIWTLLEQAPNIEITNPKDIYLSIADYLQDKQVQVTLSNFRWEEINKQTFDGATSITYSIDEDLAQVLDKGTYHLSIVIQLKDTLTKTVYENPDIVCTIR